jgi:PhnB protein
VQAVNLSPFLLFEGNCAEAMQFYQSCLGGELEVTLLRDTPMKDQAPTSLHDKVAYARLTSGSIEISATDWQHQTRVPRQGNTVGLYLSGGTLTDLKEVFDKLAVGADSGLLDELRDMPFGSYGHLADRYGVHWFFRGERPASSS